MPVKILVKFLQKRFTLVLGNEELNSHCLIENLNFVLTKSGEVFSMNFNVYKLSGSECSLAVARCQSLRDPNGTEIELDHGGRALTTQTLRDWYALVTLVGGRHP